MVTLKMYRYLLVCLTLVLAAINANAADPVLDKEAIRSISVELVQAGKDKNISVIEKYLYPGSVLIVDVDPAPDTGETQVNYEEFMKLTRAGWDLVKNAEIHEEELSLSIDKDKNQATVRAKTTVEYEMMKMKVKDVSINETTYGVVDGQIKILKYRDQLVSFDHESP